MTGERPRFAGARLNAGTLFMDDKPLLSGLPEAVELISDPAGVGCFLRFRAELPGPRHTFSMGSLKGIERFTACHRYEPFWMKAAAGVRGGEVPIETQFLLLEPEQGRCVLLVPLLDGAFRASLQGAAEHDLEVVVESGDPAVCAQSFVSLFLAEGSDPYFLIAAAAQSVIEKLGTGRLRREKASSRFWDTLGWCTWDAFYQEVSHEKVRQGLESFAAGGMMPGTLILDDGWQSTQTMLSGEKRLTSFAANHKFPGDLRTTVTMAKREFGIENFLVWHAMNGYWGGVDGEALPGYGVRAVARAFSPGILHYAPGVEIWWGKLIGLVSPQEIYRFFQDYHRHLRRQGVDGVKVDTQCSLEGVASGYGGRVALMQAYREALEGSAHTHFQGNLINCMSCSMDMLYSALNSNLTRTSTDFWPDQPGSHGLHLYVNAQVSAWFGEFVQPDWDMFQSGHPMGAYHAAGRAVGGCPVYVSDKPDAHDFDLLRKLVLPDGSILRAQEPGRPTRDCLFHDPTREEILLKIFNRNREAGVLGAFHARYEEGGATQPIHGFIRPADVEGLKGERFAVYAYSARELRLLGREERWEMTLPALGWEIFTIVPIDRAIAPIGLADMLNSGGAIRSKSFDSAGDYILTIRGSGRFLAWCSIRPSAVKMGETSLDFNYVSDTGILEFQVPDKNGELLRICGLF